MQCLKAFVYMGIFDIKKYIQFKYLINVLFLWKGLNEQIYWCYDAFVSMCICVEVPYIRFIKSLFWSFKKFVVFYFVIFLQFFFLHFIDQKKVWTISFVIRCTPSFWLAQTIIDLLHAQLDVVRPSNSRLLMCRWFVAAFLNKVHQQKLEPLSLLPHTYKKWQ